MVRGIEAMNRHRAKAGILKLKNDDGTVDEVEMMPLSTEDFPEFWIIFEGFASIDPETLKDEKNMDFKKVFEALNKERMGIVKNLVVKSMKASYPTAAPEVLEGFITKNFFDLMTLLIEINLPAIDPKDLKAIKGK